MGLRSRLLTCIRQASSAYPEIQLHYFPHMNMCKWTLHHFATSNLLVTPLKARDLLAQHRKC
ncbi:mCG134289 [Mus musculus]|nr:mCG134289 [Mus musculus]